MEPLSFESARFAPSRPLWTTFRSGRNAHMMIAQNTRAYGQTKGSGLMHESSRQGLLDIRIVRVRKVGVNRVR